MNFPGATASNVRFLSRNDQGGRPDGVQVILHKGHAFIGDMFSDGFRGSMCAIAKPEDGRAHRCAEKDPVASFAGEWRHLARREWSEHLGDGAIRTKQDYYAKSLVDSVQTEQPFAAGFRVFDISNRQRHARLPFCICPASAPIASGGSAGATPMSLCISKASSTTRWP